MAAAPPPWTIVGLCCQIVVKVPCPALGDSLAAYLTAAAWDMYDIQHHKFERRSLFSRSPVACQIWYLATTLVTSTASKAVLTF